MNKRDFLFSATAVLIILILFIGQVKGEVDKTSTVTNIIDGDTFDIATGERIRLADVDAPEYYESGYSQATDYLSSLIDGKTVYLDIDDVYTYDYSGTGDRLVCIAYVVHNSTHLLNVNKALLDGDYAVISDFYNEFNPYLWTLYSLNPVAPPTPTPEPTPTPSPTDSPSPTPTTTPPPTPTPLWILPDYQSTFFFVIVATLIFLVVVGIVYFYLKRR